MNANVLNNYGIEFRVVNKRNSKTSAGAFQKVPSAINFFICVFLEENPIEIIQDDVLVQLDNALNGKPFDEDEWGSETFLLIGTTVSTFSSTNGNIESVTIPTQYVHDIFEAWVTWITNNKLERYL